MRTIKKSARIGALGVAIATCALAADVRITSFTEPGSPSTKEQLTAVVTNTTAENVTVEVAFYRGSVRAGNASQIFIQSIPLGPRASGRVTTPEIATAESEIYSVCADPRNLIGETNENNNCEIRVVSASVSDLIVTAPGISMLPVGANVSEPMQVNAMVRNVRTVNSRAIARLYQSHPQSPSAKLLGQVNITVPPNGSTIANWSFLRPPGDTNLFVQLDEVYPREITPVSNLSSRNIYLKAIVNTGRNYGNADYATSSPAVGDLMGDGTPVMVFGEQIGNTYSPDGRVTAMRVMTDGTTKELWSRTLVPGSTLALSPALADLDGDGSPEVVVEIAKAFRDNNGNAIDGEMYVFALDKNGNTKWSTKWRTPGRAPCHNFYTTLTPVLGDMNRDGTVDVVLLEKELVILDGRNGAELMRNTSLPAGFDGCEVSASAAIADLDGDGSNEYIAASFGIVVFNSDGSVRWKNTGTTISRFALLDVDKDGAPELVYPVYRNSFEIVDARTGVRKKRSSPVAWSPSSDTIAASSSLDASGIPQMAIANNDGKNGTGFIDSSLNVKWWSLPPLPQFASENPHYVVLADLLGQGRPQVISKSDRRSIRIQDALSGEWLFNTDVFGYPSMSEAPIPVDVDGDGRGELIVSYGDTSTSPFSKEEYEPQLPQANYLIFGSDHWKKIPSTWNHNLFIPKQVDQKLSFRHDYMPYKTHNSWMQQPLRMACDIDYDDDVDQNDISLIFGARNKPAPPGDWRDIDKDGTITINDSRACTLKCTTANCAALNQPARILSVNPRNAFPGSSVQVTIRGEFANFKAGQTVANFGSGVSVGGAAMGTAGPVTVIDPNTAMANLRIQSSQSGDRTVTITTGTLSASRDGAFSLSAGNLPPLVQVGPDQTLILPGSVSVTGTATDDGMPSNRLTTTWQMIGGPGAATFADASALSTSVTFSKEGFYHLRLSATDGQYVASKDMGVTVILGNQAPYVSAGPNLTTYQNAALRLSGSVQDDGLPFAAPVTAQWSKVSGPGNILFTPGNTAATTATFSEPGVYQVRLTGYDTQYSSTSDMTVTVNPPRPVLLSVTPSSAAPGQTVNVTVKTRYTKLTAGSAQVNFGAGITASNIAVADDTTLTAQLQVASSAVLGPRAVTVESGGQQAQRPESFTVGAIGVPHSIRLNLSDLLIAPGGSITANPEVLDAAGNVLGVDQSLLTLSVAPKPGLTTGNAGKVTGFTAEFPKLQKRLLNWDQTKDPEGKYTDGDPSDPNYGRETGGIYTLVVSMQGSAVKGTQEVTVLPSGTAAITVTVQEYSKQLGSAFEAAAKAAAARDLKQVMEAKGLLGNVLSTTNFSLKVLSHNNVLAPPNGFPVTSAQIAGRFPQAPDDQAFTTKLDTLTGHIRAVRSRIQAINGTAPTQADLDALRAAAVTYKTISEELAQLSPGVLGIVQNSKRLNTLVRAELPSLLEAMAKKSSELMNAIPAQSTFAVSATATAGPELDWLLNFMSEGFPIFTDLAGYAKGNIIELGITLANSLVNIALANAVNDLSPGGLAVDFVVGGSSFSFVCPRFPNSYVEGAGFSENIDDNSVAVIGCLNSNALRTLLTLSPVKDMGAAIRLAFDIKGLAEAAGSDQSIAALENPQLMREGLFGGSQMVFPGGWPQVNQGRTPCTGIVIAFNLETGSFHAVNANMLPSCN